MSSYDRYASPRRPSRTAVIACSVVLFHVAALWAFQSGLAHKVVATIVPAEAIAYIMATPAPQEQPPPPAPPPPVPVPPTPAPTPAPRPAVVKKSTPRPAPRPQPIADSTPSPNAPVVAAAEPAPDPAPPAPAAAPEAPAAPPAPPAPPAPRIELPSSNAAYLNNPAPGYPSISRRMGEEGKVVLRVFIGTDGKPEKIEIQKSSGYDRLDRHAQDTVQRWRFVPGKRNGVPEAMWNLVPINFVLE